LDDKPHLTEARSWSCDPFWKFRFQSYLWNGETRNFQFHVEFDIDES